MGCCFDSVSLIRGVITETPTGEARFVGKRILTEAAWYNGGVSQRRI